MKTIFRAVGPAFKQGLVVEPFESVNVYALLCELLGITPEPHDGSLEAMKPMLRESAGTGRAPRQRGPAALRRAAPGFPREQRHLAAAARSPSRSRHRPEAPGHRRGPGTGSGPGPIAACRCPLRSPAARSLRPPGPRPRQPGRFHFKGV